MDAGAVTTFLVLLGVDRNQIKQDGDWVTCACPVAGLTHESGQDTRPSCRVLTRNDGPSVWYCFGCSEKAELLYHLVWTTWLAEGDYPWKASRFLAQNEHIDTSGEAEFGVPTFVQTVGVGWEEQSSQVTKIPKRVVKRFPLLAKYKFRTSTVWDWITSRGVSKATVDAFGVRYWPERRCLIFPHRSAAGDVVLLRARRVGEKSIFTVTAELANYPGVFPSRRDVGCWFGPLHGVGPRTVVVEGEFDALRLYELGITSVLASGGSKITDAQVSMLSANTVFLGMDADKAGQRANARLRRAVGAYARCYVLDWSVLGYKDAGQLQSAAEYKQVLDESNSI